MGRYGIVAVALLAACSAPPVPTADPLPAVDPAPFGLVGRTGQQLGAPLLVQGLAVPANYKGAAGNKLILIQRINGVARQEELILNLIPYFQSKSLDTYQPGKSYELRGYEQGETRGYPYWAVKEGGILFQHEGFGFVTELVILKSREIPAVEFAPADFVDRYAVLDGNAGETDGRAWITGPGWRIEAPGLQTWPELMRGKPVEVEGVIRRGASGDYAADEGKARLIRLEDQVGQKVELRGKAWSLNNHWWFRYRDVDLYVENQENLPGWNADLHGRPVMILGTLDRTTLPDLKQITLKRDRDMKDYYIVRQASWRALSR